MTEKTTANGSYSFISQYWAARRAIEPLAKYTAMLNAQDSEVAGEESGGSSFTEKLGTGAGIVGAIAGIAGLAKSSEKTADVVEMDVINYSNYPVVPWKFETSKCSLHEAPRAIYTGDNTLIQGTWYSGFEQNASQMKAHFVVGSDKTIKVFLDFMMKEKNQWVIDRLWIDDVDYDPGSEFDFNNSDHTDCLCCTSFWGNDDYPSFSVFFHTVMYDTAKSFIIFTPETPEP